MSKAEDHLIGELRKVVEGVGKMFFPLCEVVLHDLRHPDNAIVMIENSVTGRSVGDPATGLGLARLANPAFPGVLQNFRNFSVGGKELKSTSIGIKNEKGQYIAVIGINMDVGVLARTKETLDSMLSYETSENNIREELVSMSVEHIGSAIRAYSERKRKAIKDLSRQERREFVRYLCENGWLSFKNAIPTLASALGVTRTTVYNYLREANER